MDLQPAADPYNVVCRARQEPFDFMSVWVADESCMLVPHNFAVNENMVEA